MKRGGSRRTLRSCVLSPYGMSRPYIQPRQNKFVRGRHTIENWTIESRTIRAVNFAAIPWGFQRRAMSTARCTSRARSASRTNGSSRSVLAIFSISIPPARTGREENPFSASMSRWPIGEGVLSGAFSEQNSRPRGLVIGPAYFYPSSLAKAAGIKFRLHCPMTSFCCTVDRSLWVKLRLRVESSRELPSSSFA